MQLNLYKKKTKGMYTGMGSFFPNSHKWVEKKSLVHTVCAFSVPPELLRIWKIPYNLLCYTNLCEAWWLLPYKRCLPLTTVWMMMKEQRRPSALCLQKLSTFLSIPAKCCSKWWMQFFSFEVYRSARIMRYCSMSCQQVSLFNCNFS